MYFLIFSIQIDSNATTSLTVSKHHSIKYQYYPSNAIALLITISIDNFNIAGRYIIREKSNSFNSFRYLSVINSIASLLSFKRCPLLPLTLHKESQKRDYECNAIIVSENTISKSLNLFSKVPADIFATIINLIPFFNCVFDNKYSNKCPGISRITRIDTNAWFKEGVWGKNLCPIAC